MLNYSDQELDPQLKIQGIRTTKKLIKKGRAGDQRYEDDTYGDGHTL